MGYLIKGFTWIISVCFFIEAKSWIVPNNFISAKAYITRALDYRLSVQTINKYWKRQLSISEKHAIFFAQIEWWKLVKLNLLQKILLRLQVQQEYDHLTNVWHSTGAYMLNHHHQWLVVQFRKTSKNRHPLYRYSDSHVTIVQGKDRAPKMHASHVLLFSTYQ